MSHLRIKVLGPLEAWHVDDDGFWEPLPVAGEGGATRAGFFAALAFLPGRFKWKALAEYLWDPKDVAADSKRFATNLRKTKERAQKCLGEHGKDALPAREHRLGGRGVGAEARRVHLDWDDAKQFKVEENWQAALSLFAGLPLEAYRKDEDEAEDVRELESLVDTIYHEEDGVEKFIHDCLRQLGLPIPKTLSSAQLTSFAPPPPEWQPQLREPEPLIETEESRAPHGVPTLFGAYAAQQLFERCYEGELRLGQERDEAAAEGRGFWWAREQWLGKYVALWSKRTDVACDTVKFTYVDDVYDAARIGHGAADKLKAKATLIEAPKLLEDNDDRQIICGKTNWGVAHIFARNHSHELLEHSERFSVFGIRERPVYPTILGVHVLAQTRDGFVLFALRSPEVDFYELTWSASFEESVSIGPRRFTGPTDTGDETVLHAIQGGLREEWGIEEEAISATTCLAVGREWARERHGDESWLSPSPTILTACRLNLDLVDVWSCLDEEEARDREEHRDWVGCRFEDRAAVLSFLAWARERTSSTNLFDDLDKDLRKRVKLERYPGGSWQLGDNGLMPTSAARLVLGSAWLVSRGHIDK